MINLVDQTITLMNKTDKIKVWSVWFETPVGLTDNIDNVREYCLANDFDMNMCITPVPVAIGEEGLYEVVKS